ncbi:hypothetical protein CSC12_5108 [Klebsiella michiganensis]|nr:hypothetical protein CSC12_5108 [Klebsiella michiganensis]
MSLPPKIEGANIEAFCLFFVTDFLFYYHNRGIFEKKTPWSFTL